MAGGEILFIPPVEKYNTASYIQAQYTGEEVLGGKHMALVVIAPSAPCILVSALFQPVLQGSTASKA